MIASSTQLCMGKGVWLVAVKCGWWVCIATLSGQNSLPMLARICTHLLQTSVSTNKVPIARISETANQVMVHLYPTVRAGLQVTVGSLTNSQSLDFRTSAKRLERASAFSKIPKPSAMFDGFLWGKILAELLPKPCAAHLDSSSERYELSGKIVGPNRPLRRRMKLWSRCGWCSNQYHLHTIEKPIFGLLYFSSG